jgi:hypothetical protein
MECWTTLSCKYHSARATSAAPMYFEPFFSENAGAWCLDGGLISNNPVQVALNGSKDIWGKDIGIDVLVSIGSGHARSPLLKSPYGGSTKIEHWAEQLLGSFLKSMSGEKLWEEFWTNNPKHQPCVRRLNVQFPREQECELDDVNSIAEMEKIATACRLNPRKGWLEHHNKVFPTPAPPDSLMELACRLRASLFFFQPECIELTESKPAAVIRGTIYCRLHPKMTGYKKLGNVTSHFLYHDERLTKITDITKQTEDSNENITNHAEGFEQQETEIDGASAPRNPKHMEGEREDPSLTKLETPTQEGRNEHITEQAEGSEQQKSEFNAQSAPSKSEHPGGQAQESGPTKLKYPEQEGSNWENPEENSIQEFEGNLRFKYPVKFQHEVEDKDNQEIDIKVKFVDGTMSSISGFPTTFSVIVFPDAIF